MGPTIHAEVGDTITVVFRNNTRFPVGIHPHGVLYAKSSEGAHYATDAAPAGQEPDHDNMPETGANVEPKGQYTYHWDVPERAGPGPSDPSSVVWLYHAHDHESVDIYAGLIGAIVVTRSGGAMPDGIPKDVDREFVTLFMIIDENASPYLDANIQRFAGKPAAVSKKDGEFKESNKKHTINGLLYGNLDGLTMRRGERVRWYLIGLGNENDIHTAHWHGNTVLRRGSRTDTVELFPATTEVVDMHPDNVGTWLFHCHVTETPPIRDKTDLPERKNHLQRPEIQCLGQASRLLFRPGVPRTCEHISGRRTDWTSAAKHALLWVSAGGLGPPPAH
jgi:FtsP/CotA-like multicopper oxidase with cupredoxin domain